MFDSKLMDRLASILNDVTEQRTPDCSVAERGTAIKEAMAKRDADGALSEILSWCDYDCDDVDMTPCACRQKTTKPKLQRSKK